MKMDVRTVEACFQRGDLGDVWGNFDGASIIAPGPHDDREITKKVAYWIGRNAEIIQSAARQAGREAEAIMERSADEERYLRDLEAIYQRYAKRDADGNFVLAKAAEDREAYTFDGDNERLCVAAVESLKADQAAVVAGLDAKTDTLRAFLEQPVKLSLYAIDFDALPSTMSGGYVAAIRQMLFNLPDENEG